MPKLKALLIGVSTYPDKIGIQSLPVVKQDINNLAIALRSIGCDVSEFQPPDGIGASRSAIYGAIRRECRNADDGIMLILYFGGHGIHFKGKDYLLPADIYLDDPEILQDLLIPTDIADVIDESKADTIIWMIDACREGIELRQKAVSAAFGEKSVYLAKWSEGDALTAKKRAFLLVFGCASGQVCQYADSQSQANENYSFFTRALCDVLRSDCAGKTIGEIISQTQSNLNAVVHQHQKKRQEIHTIIQSSTEENPLDKVLVSNIAPVSDTTKPTNIAPKDQEKITNTQYQHKTILPPNECVKSQPPRPFPLSTNRDDKQKGRWGGHSSVNGRRLVVTVTEIRRSVFYVDCSVTSEDGSNLCPPVVFFLHDSYDPESYWIRKIRDGRTATLEEVECGGMFTVGALVMDHEGNWIGLEYDMTQIVGIPKRFDW